MYFKDKNNPFSFYPIENFIKEDPSGRLPYSSIPPILQRFGIIITENDATSAAKDLGYNSKMV